MKRNSKGNNFRRERQNVWSSKAVESEGLGRGLKAKGMF